MADDSFKEFVTDQLSALPELRIKAMFGGHGIYSGERFFGILAEGRMFFKTDDSTRADYESRGMPLFSYEMKGLVKTMNYSEVPPEVLEDRSELIVWANRAIQLAVDRSKKSKPAKRQSS